MFVFISQKERIIRGDWKVGVEERRVSMCVRACAHASWICDWEERKSEIWRQQRRSGEEKWDEDFVGRVVVVWENIWWLGRTFGRSGR